MERAAIVAQLRARLIVARLDGGIIAHDRGDDAVGAAHRHARAIGDRPGYRRARSRVGVERGGIAGQVELLRLASVFKPPERHAQTPRAARLFERERSEEHTSELQSLMRISYAVFCLKKKKNTKRET